MEKILRKALSGKMFKKGVDLGCGDGRWGYILKDYCNYLIGVDKNFRRLSVALEFGGYDEVILADIRYYEIPEDADAVFLIEVLEHLTKEDGYNLLKRIGNRFCLVTTPATFSRFSLRNSHISLWSTSDFEKLGFKTSTFNYGISYFFLNGILAVKEVKK